MRALAAVAVGALITAIAVVLIVNPTDGGFPECPYRKLNFKCTSCGATRAVYYFFTLQFGKAFYYHAYFTLTSPLVAYYIVAIFVNAFACKRVLPIWWQVAFGYVLGLVAFTVLRNFTDVIY